MTSRGKESGPKNKRRDSFPHSSATPQRTEAAILADEVPGVAVAIQWPRMPEPKQFGATAEHFVIADGRISC